MNLWRKIFALALACSVIAGNVDAMRFFEGLYSSLIRATAEPEERGAKRGRDKGQPQTEQPAPLKQLRRSQRIADLQVPCNNFGETPLHAAARYNTPERYYTQQDCGIEEVQALLDAGALIDAEDKTGTTPLINAIMKNNEFLALYLLEAGANPDHQDIFGYTPLTYAVNEGLNDVMRVLVNYGVDVERPLRHHLRHAHNERKITALIDIIGLDYLAKGNKSLLMLACEHGRFSAARYLLDRRADHYFRDAEGNTPLHYCTLSRVALLLISRGADINIHNNYGQTPYQRMDNMMREYEIDPCLLYLLQGAPRLKRVQGDENHDTVAHLAVRNGDLNFIRFLQEKNVGLKVKNKDGLTPLELAKQLEKQAVINLLEHAPIVPAVVPAVAYDDDDLNASGFEEDDVNDFSVS